MKPRIRVFATLAMVIILAVMGIAACLFLDNLFTNRTSISKSASPDTVYVNVKQPVMEPIKSVNTLTKVKSFAPQNNNLTNSSLTSKGVVGGDNNTVSDNSDNHVVNGVNNGVNGDVNIGNRQRHLNDQSRTNLVNRIGALIKQNNLPQDVEISLSFPMGNGEAWTFLQEIGAFLIEKGYNVNREAGQNINGALAIEYSGDHIHINCGLDEYP